MSLKHIQLLREDAKCTKCHSQILNDSSYISLKRSHTFEQALDHKWQVPKLIFSAYFVIASQYDSQDLQLWIWITKSINLLQLNLTKIVESYYSWNPLYGTHNDFLMSVFLYLIVWVKSTTTKYALKISFRTCHLLINCLFKNVTSFLNWCKNFHSKLMNGISFAKIQRSKVHTARPRIALMLVPAKHRAIQNRAICG